MARKVVIVDANQLMSARLIEQFNPFNTTSQYNFIAKIPDEGAESNVDVVLLCYDRTILSGCSRFDTIINEYEDRNKNVLFIFVDYTTVLENGAVLYAFHPPVTKNPACFHSLNVNSSSDFPGLVRNIIAGPLTEGMHDLLTESQNIRELWNKIQEASQLNQNLNVQGYYSFLWKACIGLTLAGGGALVLAAIILESIAFAITSLCVFAVSAGGFFAYKGTQQKAETLRTAYPAVS